MVDLRNQCSSSKLYTFIKLKMSHKIQIHKLLLDPHLCIKLHLLGNGRNTPKMDSISSKCHHEWLETSSRVLKGGGWLKMKKEAQNYAYIRYNSKIRFFNLTLVHPAYLLLCPAYEAMNPDPVLAYTLFVPPATPCVVLTLQYTLHTTLVRPSY